MVLSIVVQRDNYPDVEMRLSSGSTSRSNSTPKCGELNPDFFVDQVRLNGTECISSG